MFKGIQSIKFTTDKPSEIVYEIIRTNLENIGKIDFFYKWKIIINGSRFSNYLYNSHIVCKVKENEGKYLIEIEWDVEPNWIIIIIVVIFSVGLGLILLLYLIIPSNDIKREAFSTLEKIRFELE